MEQLHIDESLTKKDIIGIVVFIGLVLISPAILIGLCSLNIIK